MCAEGEGGMQENWSCVASEELRLLLIGVKVEPAECVIGCVEEAEK